MNSFSGNELREIRKKHRLTRLELADYLGVSAVTVEKWEQRGANKIRPKYYDKIASLTGASAMGLGVGLTAAPALLPFVALVGAGALYTGIIGDSELEQASILLEKLKKLQPEDRQEFFNLVRKMNS